MDAIELKRRTKQFALEIIAMADALPKSTSSWVIAKQIVRSATSIGANYRSACRARSKADFLSKITIVEEEADETQYWLELLNEGKILPEGKLKPLQKEAAELTAIFTAIGKTTRKNSQFKPANPQEE